MPAAESSQSEPAQKMCTGSRELTANGIESEIKRLRDKMEEIDNRLFTELMGLKEDVANIKVVMEHNKHQDKNYEDLKQEVSDLNSSVKANKTLLDKAIGAGLLLVFLIPAVELFFIHRADMRDDRSESIKGSETALIFQRGRVTI